MPLKFWVCFLLFALAVPVSAQPASIAISAPGSVACPGGVPSPCWNLIHGQSLQLTATVSGTAPFDPSVIWSFSPTIGTLSSSGLYTAPASVFQLTQITVKATSAQSSAVFKTATIYLIPTVQIGIGPSSSVNLSDGQQIQFTATVTGTANTAVTWSISPDGLGSIDNTGLYTAPVPITSRQTVTVKVVSVADPNQSATATVTLIPSAQVGITVNPRAVTIRNGGDTQQFTATVVGLTSTSVTWSISPQVGQILSTGLYIAPDTINTNQQITVTATSVANSSFSGTATVTLTPPAIQVTPSSVTLNTNQTQQFAASVNGNPFPDVSWSLSSGFGAITASGLYTAPAFAPARLVIQVIATANADPTRTGAATVTINQSTATLVPASVSLTSGGTQQFSFNIDGVPDPDPAAHVQWSLSPSNLGSISAAGLYTAPASVGNGATVTLTATYLPDATKTARATITLNVFTDVGHGAPNAAIQQLFITNFYRNGFYNLVSVPPMGDVKRLGATGYVQEFQDANKTSGVRFALVKPNASTAPPADGAPLIFQLYGDLYGYYSTVGVNTAGYPTMDTQSCPFFDPNNTCQWDLFDKNYALFVYKVPVFASQTQFSVSGAIYTKWTALGGMLGGPGRPIDAAVAVTSSTKVTANVQTFAGGAIYQITSGANNGQVYAVLGTINNLYQNQGGPAGYLGVPTGNEIVQTNGDHRQTFEGGALQYTPGSDPVVRLPVGSVALSATGTLKMNAGDTTTVRATPITTSGAGLTDRTVTWSTTNGQVVTITSTAGNGASATLKAVGAGTASVRASADGIVSLPLVITVTAPCCQVGEGAPTTIISQAFQNAVTRNHLNVVLPAANPVSRMGHGYVQQLLDAAPNSGNIYLVAKSDNAAAAYVVAGAVLARYQQLGGPAGTLGYPMADATAGGTQTFEAGAALSGSPAVLVTGVVFTKWSGMGLESGAAGAPLAEAAAFTTVGANAGSAQNFKNGVIYGATRGPKAGQAYFSSGLILARYNAIGGPGGAFGMPASDEFVSGTTHRQNFENGYIDYNTGDTSAQAHAAAQKPAVTAPQSVLAGSRLHLAISGFQPGATVRVSITGQSDFTVSTPNGAYAWDVYVPLNARAAAVAIHAADVNGTDAADAGYNVLSLANNRAAFAKTQGDVQSAPPGALAPLPLVAVLRDPSGNPVIGAPVVFQASPGAQLVESSAATDASGQAQTGVRLPMSQGLAAVTVDSPGIAAAPVTFFVTANPAGLTAFPKLMQSGKAALTAAAASMVRYFQNRGDVPAPNGLADPATLSQFLKSFCATDTQGRQLCDGYLVNPDAGEQVANLWRAGEFVGGSLDVAAEKPGLSAIRDLVAQGAPVLLALSLTADGAPAGGHFVVAIGVGAAGEVLIHDPNPNFAQPQLDNYLNGFSSVGRAWTAQLQAVVRLVPRVPPATRFLLAAVSQPAALVQNLTLEARSIAGACGLAVDFTDAADPAGALPAGAPRVTRFVACDGAQPLYQINAGAPQPYRVTLTDLGKGGGATDLSASGPASYKASRAGLLLQIAPQDLTVLADGILNAASFTPAIAPGGLFSIFGSGLAGADSSTAVSINGTAAPVVAATPFQINAQAPPELAPGSYVLQVQSPFGTASANIALLANAPSIFAVGAGAAAAIVNQDGVLNSNTHPALRGQVVTIYATGLGTTTRQGSFSVVTAPVAAVLAGAELNPTFAGLTAGFIGLYQVNLPIPAGTPPGLDLPLLLRQGGQDGNVVYISVQ